MNNQHKPEETDAVKEAPSPTGAGKPSGHRCPECHLPHHCERGEVNIKDCTHICGVEDEYDNIIGASEKSRKDFIPTAAG